MNTHSKGLSDRQMQGKELRNVMETALSGQQMSVSALARDSHVQRADIYRWWRGETRPTRNSLARIAETLHIDTRLLRSALGEPIGATETPAGMVAALNAQTEAITELVAVLRPLVEDHEARVRALEAERALDALPGDEAPRVRSAPRETRG
jgi:transcriptional regulator with XRE-family HTH domain